MTLISSLPVLAGTRGRYRRFGTVAAAAALALVLATAPALAGGHAAPAGHGGGKEETAPETYVVLDLFSEMFEASVAGVGVKIAELKPKVEHINELYKHGEKHKAFAQVLGISTELVVLGFCIETFGIGDLFMSALSFGGNWAIQLAQSTVGVMASTKVALLAGEKVEEATEEKYEHAIHREARARASSRSTLAEANH
ncbi:MAG: hypothetical protein WCJ64_19500 [Rhodospirillaceae bacterium]